MQAAPHAGAMWGQRPVPALRRGGRGDIPPAAHSLADVLGAQLLPAGLALEAAQVPVLFQCHQRLPVLDFQATASTACREEQNADSSRRAWLAPQAEHHQGALGWPGAGGPSPTPALLFAAPTELPRGPGDGDRGTLSQGRGWNTRKSCDDVGPRVYGAQTVGAWAGSWGWLMGPLGTEVA